MMGSDLHVGTGGNVAQERGVDGVESPDMAHAAGWQGDSIGVADESPTARPINEHTTPGKTPMWLYWKAPDCFGVVRPQLWSEDMGQFMKDDIFAGVVLVQLGKPPPVEAFYKEQQAALKRQQDAHYEAAARIGEHLQGLVALQGGDANEADLERCVIAMWAGL